MVNGNCQDLIRLPFYQLIIPSNQKGFWTSPPQKVNGAIQIISRSFPGERIIVEPGQLAARLEYFLTAGFYSCYHAAEAVGGKKP
jgi:hypothetical protein